MNEKNVDYLKKLMFHLGFGEKLNDVLETAINRELPRFALGLNNYHRPLETKDPNTPKSDFIFYDLRFNRAKDSDSYFLSNYTVSLYKGNELSPRRQTFDLEKDHRITALQAYKLLSGLSFEKDIYVRPKGAGVEADKSEKVKAWFKLNMDVIDDTGNHPLKLMRPEYGFDLEATLARYPLKGLDKEPQRTEALKNLSNGNYAEASIMSGRKQLPVLIAANPQMKSLELYDLQMREIRNEEIWPEKGAVKTASAAQGGPSISPANLEQEDRPWEQGEEPGQEQKVGR
jgi:hypothetical protein